MKVHFEFLVIFKITLMNSAVIFNDLILCDQFQVQSCQRIEHLTFEIKNYEVLTLDQIEKNRYILEKVRLFVSEIRFLGRRHLDITTFLKKSCSVKCKPVIPSIIKNPATKFVKKYFSDWRKYNFDFEFPIEMSVFPNFQNYRKPMYRYDDFLKIEKKRIK